MNDGKEPKKGGNSIRILPFVTMAIIIGLFIWYLVAQFSGATTLYESKLDGYFDYQVAYNETSQTYEYEFGGDAQYQLNTVSVSQGYKAVTVSGSLTNVSENKKANYTVMIEEDKWNQSFETYVLVNDGPSKGQVVTVTHASYSSVFSSPKVLASTGTYAVTDAFAVSWWDTWGPTIITFALTAFIAFFLFSRLSSSIGGAGRGVMDFNKSPARRENVSKVHFDDVAGCDEEKAEMVELVEYLKDPKKYSQFGARLPKGVLLCGNPGTGKTLLAKAVAGEAKVPFFSISGSDFVEMYVGVGAGRVRDLFKKAKAAAPCLIFIDEIDAVGRQRGAGLGGGNDEREQTLNQLLVEMDGFEPNTGILVIAATNRDDVLDPALRRAGRFDRTIVVSMPDRKGREAIFKVHARNKKIGPGVDFDALAKRTVGFSGADIDNVLNEAAILAVRRGAAQIEINDIDEAIDRRISGPAKSGKGMSPEERKSVAYHEAGHAVIGLNLPYSDKVQKITIIPRGNTGGHVLMTPEDDRFLLTKNQLLARITGLLGGRVSEEIFFKDVSTGASNDIQEATRLARLMVTQFGMSDLGPIQYEQDNGSVFLGRDYNNTSKNFSTQVAFEIDKAVREIIEQAHKDAKNLLEKHKNQVILIAETLLENETITAEEIDVLLKEGRLPHKAATTVICPKCASINPASGKYCTKCGSPLAEEEAKSAPVVAPAEAKPVAPKAAAPKKAASKPVAKKAATKKPVAKKAASSSKPKATSKQAKK